MFTRIDPELALPQLRARGGLELDAEEVELLRARTEGWPAAMFLAGYWLRRVGYSSSITSC